MNNAIGTGKANETSPPKNPKVSVTEYDMYPRVNTINEL
jgi:hypothetical protein